MNHFFGIGGSRKHLGLLMMNTKYAIFSNILYILPVYPSIILIPNNVTHVLLHKHKQVYDENLRFFHKLRGVKQYLIQQITMAIDRNYIIAMNNRIIGQFMGNIRQIFA